MTTGAADDADDDPRRALNLHNTSSPSENWDDDFEFQLGAADRDRDSERDATNAPRRAEHSHEQEESWDDAYEDDDPDASPIKRAPKADDEDVEDWDSSDNEAHDEHDHEHEQRTQRDEGREFGVGAFEEEDKTVTARSSSSRVRARDLPPALPLPPFPPHVQHSQHPPLSFTFHAAPHPLPSTSPTLSTFSIPISSNRASIYSQDPLMPSTSNSSAPHLSSLPTMRSYPQAAGSTPPRKGRRLRKKSRPPEADIFELEDRDPDPLPLPPSIPIPEYERPSTPPPRPASPLRPSTPPPPSNGPAESRSPQPTPSPSLLTRIGSLKRWARRSVGPEDPSTTGWRRAKSSTGPSETGRMGKSSIGPEELALAEEDLRAVSPTPAPGEAKKGRVRRSRGESASGQKAGWFFRAGGGGSERDEGGAAASFPAAVPAPAAVQTPDPSPSKRSSALGLRRKDKDKDGGETPTPRKAKAKLVPALKTGVPMPAQVPSQPSTPTRMARDETQRHQGQRPVSMQPQRSMLFPRNGSASVGRSAGAPLSISISGPAISTEHDKEREREGGMRSLMNGVRRLSLVGGGGHKRTKSTGGDVGAVEVARQSRAEERPTSRPSTAESGGRPASRGSGMGTQGRGEKEVHALLPPVELDSPLSVQFASRGALPWGDHDPTSASSAGYAGGSSAAGSPDSHTRSPASLFPAPNQHLANGHSFSASATSLLAGSPPRPARSPTAPIPVPVPTQSFGTIPRSRTAPHPPQIPAPQPHSASLGRSTASPSSTHPGPGLRRNSLGDLKLQTPPRGELKIPARISRAQYGLKRDMGMVREFARCVEHLKRLQMTYMALLGNLRAAYDASPTSPGSRPTSPTQVQFHLPSRPPSQSGTTRKMLTANPNTSVQSVHQAMSPHPPRTRPSHDVGRELTRLEHEYGIWWECAELLVELGGGSESVTASNPNLTTHSASAATTPAGEPFRELVGVDESVRVGGPGLHVTSMSEPGSIFEHALPVTSNGPPQASPPHPSQWRASTGRHDLSARQLRLLKDMLNTPDPASLAYAAGPYGYGAGYPHPHPHSYPYAVEEGESARPWAPWNPSAITLPSEESSADPHVPSVPYAHLPGASVGRSEGKEKKRRASRLGMLGLRDLLRSLKRNAVAEGRLGGAYTHRQQSSESSASNSAEDDHYNRRHSPWHQHDTHHTARVSTGPEEVAATLNTPPRPVMPKSPRRPSLASIFRIGQKGSKNGSGRSKDVSTSGNGNSTTEDERDADLGGGTVGEYSDWERMSRSDLDLATAVVGSGTATVRGKKKAQQSGSSSNSNLPYSQAPHPNNTVNLTTPKKTPATSQTSLWDSSPPAATPPQSSRLPLSIAEEDIGLHALKSKTPVPPRPSKERTPSWSQTNPTRPGSRNGKPAITGTVRSAPPADLSSAPDPKLALTPDNIKPLLEYAREVSTRLGECIDEVQSLLTANASAKAL